MGDPFPKSSNTACELSFRAQCPELEFVTGSAGMLLLQPHQPAVSDC